MCQTRILSQSETIVISVCQRCKLIYLWNNNLLLTVSEQKFRSLYNTIKYIDFDACSIPFPDGEFRAIIATPGNEVNMTLGFEELEHFKDLMQEAEYMLDVYALMV